MVAHHSSKVDVASSSLVSRSTQTASLSSEAVFVVGITGMSKNEPFNSDHPQGILRALRP